MEVHCAALTSSDVQSEDDQGGEMESEEDPQNWQSLVGHDVLASLTPQEIKRQEVINGEATAPHGVHGAVEVRPAFHSCVCVCFCLRAILYRAFPPAEAEGVRCRFLPADEPGRDPPTRGHQAHLRQPGGNYSAAR